MKDNLEKLIREKDALLEKQSRLMQRQQKLIDAGLQEIESMQKQLKVQDELLTKQADTADKMILSFDLERRKWEDLSARQNSLIDELNQLIQKNVGRTTPPSAN